MAEQGHSTNDGKKEKWKIRKVDVILTELDFDNELCSTIRIAHLADGQIQAYVALINVGGR